MAVLPNSHNIYLLNFKYQNIANIIQMKYKNQHRYILKCSNTLNRVRRCDNRIPISKPK